MIALAALALAALAVPLWVVPCSFEAFLLPKIVLSATLAALAAAGWLFQDAGALASRLSDGRARAWAALLAAFGVSYALSPARPAAVAEFALAMSWTLAGLVAAVGLRSARDGRRLAAAASLSAVAAAAWSLWQGPGSPSSLGNPSFLGSYLAGCGPLLLWLSAAEPEPFGWLWAAGLAVAGAALIGTGTRGAWLAAAVAWPPAAVAARRAARAAGRPRWLRAAAACGLGALLAAAALSGSFALRRARGAAAIGESRPLQERLLMWRAAWDMLADRPLIGQGPGGYHYFHLERQARLLARPDLADRRRYWTHTQSAHDAYLDLAAETGVLGLAAFAAVLLLAGRAWARARREEPASEASLRDAWACAALALLVDGLAGLTLQLPASALLLAVALGGASAPAVAPAAAELPGRARRPVLLAAGLASLLLALGVARLWLYQAAEVETAQAAKAAARADYPAAEKKLRLAASLSASCGRARFFLGNVLLLLERPDEAAAALAEASRLISDPNIPYDRGLADLARGDLASARTWTLEALRLKPAFPEALATLGDLARREGRLDEARGWFERSLALAPGHPAMMRELGLVDLRLNRRAPAAELLAAVNRLYPEDAEVAQALGRLRAKGAVR